MVGSARVSRVGDGVLAVANFLKACFGGTPKPTRETRALPKIVEVITLIISRLGRP
jgi:hypothetical protein